MPTSVRRERAAPRLQDAIHAALQVCANVDQLELERPVGRNIADIFATIDGTPVAIEVQRTALGVDELVERTVEYHRQRTHVLWIAFPTEELFFSEYSPRAWEHWCHAMYGGRAYYWIQGETLLPVHFDPCRIPVPEFIQRDARGRTTVLGGGSRLSSRFRTPNHGPRIRISNGFAPRLRPEWRGDRFRIPACSVYVDTLSPWWIPARS